MHNPLIQTTMLAMAVGLTLGNVLWAQESADAPAETEAPATLNTNPITVHVIGFDVDQETTDQLTAIANAGGGRYIPAENEAELTSALGEVTNTTLQPTLTNEKEDNNSLGKANRVAPSGSVKGTIDPKGDDDWFIFETDLPGTLNLSVTNVPAELDIAARVFNADRSAVGNYINPLRAGAETEGVVHLTSAGRHYVTLLDGKSDAASSDPYTLNLEFLPADAFEPNNSFGRARSVAMDTDVFASILPQGDQDWFMFDVPRRGALHVRITEPPENLEVQYRVYSAEGSALVNWAPPLRAGADNIGVVDLPREGRYYLQISDVGDNAYSAAKYKLQLSFDSGDKGEPNETIGTATKIDPNAQLLASILPRGDEDWYYFDIDHPGAIEVAITQSPINQDLHFRVFTAERSAHMNWVAPLRAGADNVETVDLPSAGRWYLVVTDGKGDERSAQQYSLQLRFDRADAYEPNNSWGTAVPVSVNQSIQASILPRGDQDWYMFEVPATGSVQIATGDVPAALDLSARVFNAEGSAVTNNLHPLRAGAELNETVDLSAAGRYYLLVFDNQHDARAAEPYTVNITHSAQTESE